MMDCINKRYDRLKITEIQPEGWFFRQMEIQMNGLSGKLYEIWDSVGSYSGWLGGTGENWERGPYYLDGLLPLAYYLKNEEKMALCQRFIDWTLNSQTEDGNFGPFASREDYWSRFVMLKVLIQYEEISGDTKVFSFMKKYFTYLDKAVDIRPMEDWSSARVGELLYCLKWYCEATGETGLTDFAHKMEKQALDWSDLFENFPFIRPASYYYNWQQLLLEARDRTDKIIKYHATHIVNVTMGLKYPALEYYFGGKSSLRDLGKKTMETLKKYHGVVSGAVNGDEHLSGNSPIQGSELCSVVEYMFSLQVLLEIFGDMGYADMLERLAYNALPSTLTEDCMGHQYLQQSNQVLVSKAERNWFNNDDTSNMYGLEPHFGCCTANMHQGWPKLADSLWMKEGKDTLISLVLAPSVVAAGLDGEEVSVRLDTEYPFKDTLRYEILKAPQKPMKLKIRVPGWCSEPRAELIKGQEVTVEINSFFIEVSGLLSPMDRIDVVFPMDIVYSSWYKNSVAIERGPLVYGLNMKEHFTVYKECAGIKDYMISSESPWNYALKKGGRVQVSEHEVSAVPFSKSNPPVTLTGTGIRVDNWILENDSAGDIPASPVTNHGNEEILELIPFGCTRLRVSQFPYYE